MSTNRKNIKRKNIEIVYDDTPGIDAWIHPCCKYFKGTSGGVKKLNEANQQARLIRDSLQAERLADRLEALTP